MELTDDELDNVVGGGLPGGNSTSSPHWPCLCDNRYVGETGMDCDGNYYEKCGNCGDYIN